MVRVADGDGPSGDVHAGGHHALVVGDEFAIVLAGVLERDREQRQIVVGQHQRGQLIGKRDESDRLGCTFGNDGGRDDDTDRPVPAQERYRVGGDRPLLDPGPRQHRVANWIVIIAAARQPLGLVAARLEVHQHVDRLGQARRVDRLVVVVADLGLRKAGGLDRSLCGREFGRLQPGDPTGHDEIGLEGIDRRAQRLEHVGLQHRWRAEQA